MSLKTVGGNIMKDFDYNELAMHVFLERIHELEELLDKVTEEYTDTAYWETEMDPKYCIENHTCSKCGCQVGRYSYKYCPNCGRKMITGKNVEELLTYENISVPNTIDDYFPKVSDKEIPYSVERGWEETLRYERNHDLDSGN
jgi:hypothetical protein